MITTTASLVSRIVALLRLRGGPQDFPHSPRLAVALLAVGISLDAANGIALGRGAQEPARALLSASVVLGLSWVALAIRRLTARYLQTATALLACGAAFALMSLAIAPLMAPALAADAPLDGGARVLAAVALGLFFWQLAVLAHIMRNAMDSGFGFALCLVASWVVAYWALDRLLFGPPA